jgi:ferrous iron transport protein B
MKEIRIAVVGNPNTGKSSLINAIAKARLQVGNWPGVTVEKKEAKIEYNGYVLHFIDLPGAYSLTPFSLDESIARDFLFTEDYDVILCVVDTTNLERNLYFVVQLMELEKPLVLALNMFDEVKKLGYKVKVSLLEELLGVKAIPTIAVKEQGIEELKQALVQAYENKLLPKKLPYGDELEPLIERLRVSLSVLNPDFNGERKITLAIVLKVLEGDEELLQRLNLRYDPKDWEDLLSHLKKVHEVEPVDYLLDVRYGLATGVARQVLERPEIRRETLTEKIDKVALSRVLGIPFFLLVMWLAFKVVFDVGNPYVDFFDKTMNEVLKNWVNHGLEGLGAPDWIVSLVGDGIITGVGTVLSFFPIIGLTMLMITFLEASGYMARAAFLMDRIMRNFGLQGKAFIPLLIGLGCNMPAAHACRILENEKERKLTMFVLPFMSCGARLPVYAVFVSIFFPNNQAEVILFLYLLGIIVALFVASILHKVYFKGISTPFIMELPPYRFPTLKNLAIHTWLKFRHFVVKAGTFILLINLIIWMALNLPWKPDKPEDSILGKVGHFLAPVFSPLGFGDWAASASLLTGFTAKEVIVSSMAQIYVIEKEEDKEDKKDLSLKEDLIKLKDLFADKTKEAVLNLTSTFGIASLTVELPEEGKGLVAELPKRFTKAGALAFLVFVLLCFPCMAYAATVRAESGSLKLVLQIMGTTLATAYIVSFIVYQLAKLFLRGI